MTRLSAALGLAGVAGLLLMQDATAADPRQGMPAGGFRATCEDLGTLCFADACGGDQIAAALSCQARCPSAVILSVVPAACRAPDVRPITAYRRRS